MKENGKSILEYIFQIIKEIERGTFREAKKLTWDQVENGVIASNQS